MLIEQGISQGKQHEHQRHQQKHEEKDVLLIGTVDTAWRLTKLNQGKLLDVENNVARKDHEKGHDWAVK